MLENSSSGAQPRASDIKTASDNYARYARARDARHAKYVDRALKLDRFYCGDQWDETDRARLAAEGRPALTLNMVLATINTALGEHLNSMADIQFKPAKQGDEDLAAVHNKVFRYISEQNDLEDLEAYVVADGYVQERGYYDVRMNFEHNVAGDVAIRVENPLDVIPDPDASSPDPKDWAEFFITRWMTTEDVAVTYGVDKARQLQALGENNMTFGPDSVELASPTFGDENGNPVAPEDPADAVVTRVRVIERQYYKLRKVKQLVDIRTGDVRDLPESLQQADREQVLQEVVRTYSNVSYREITKKDVRMTITCDKVVLFDDWSIYRSFTIVPFFPYFRRGNPFGMGTNLLSPQELLNKTSSQELHIVNTTANSGWIVEEDSLVNMDTDELSERGAETGLVVEYRRTSQAPDKIQPNQIPTGIDRISQKAMMSVRQISGVNESLSGNDRADVSGVAIAQRKESGQTQLAVPHKSIARTRKILARKCLELVQDFFTESRILFLTDTNEPEQPKQAIEINQPQPDGSILNDVTQGEYSIVVGTQPSRDTHDETQFAEAIQLREIGVAIPDHIIVEHSNLTRRTEVARMLKDMQGFGEMTEEQAALQAFQQQVMIEQARLELEKIEAEINDLRAKAELNQAKADSMDGYNEAAIRLKDMENRRQMAEDQLNARVQLALVSSRTQLTQTDKSNAAKIATEMLKAKSADKQREASKSQSKETK